MTANIQVSGKLPDGRIYVLGADTYAEFAGLVQDFYGPKGERVIEDFIVLLDPPLPGYSSPAPPSAPAQSTPPPPGGPSCRHGARTFRGGVGKKGPWTAWFCPQPKGSDQCDPQWGE